MSESDTESSSAIRCTSYHDSWKYRYHTAAIFLQQGANNDKFDNHPQGHRALPAYMMVQAWWLHLLDIGAGLVLLALALFEDPKTIDLKLGPWLHTIIELLCLFIICMKLGVKLQWLGWRAYIKHKLTATKTFFLFVMFVEACVVLVRQNSHFRITRAFRPIFLIDSKFSYNVRRFVRQIFLSLLPVADMLLLLLMFMFVFSVLGYFMFKDIDALYFGSPWTSFISLFVLLTTANNPDVMMKAYAYQRSYAIFFIVYLCIELYFLQNLLLAVVYDAFAGNEKMKFRKLFVHRREGAVRAFIRMAETNSGTELSIERFIGMMRFLKPRMSLRNVYLCFKALDKRNRGKLEIEDFHRIYDIYDMDWIMVSSLSHYYETYPTFIKIALYKIHNLVNKPLFAYFFYFLEFLVAIWFFVYITLQHYRVSVFLDEDKAVSRWINLIFTLVFMLECILKLIGLGLKKYIGSGWNKLDMLLTFASVIGLMLNQPIDSVWSQLVVLRIISLCKFLRLKRRYRDIFNTVTILVPRFVSAAIVLLLIYYFFAIVGMELFHQFDSKLKNCCKNTSVENEYYYNASDPANMGYYYLNNFSYLTASAVTLWDLMVVNNWFIIMEGYASVAGEWYRLFFMVYYIVMMVVLTIVVAFILEGFVFRIKCSRETPSDMRDTGTSEVEVELIEGEVNMINDKEEKDHIIRGHADYNITQEQMSTFNNDNTNAAKVLFKGKRSKNRFDFSKELYADEIQEWIVNDSYITSLGNEDDLQDLVGYNRFSD